LNTGALVSVDGLLKSSSSSAKSSSPSLCSGIPSSRRLLKPSDFSKFWLTSQAAGNEDWAVTFAGAVTEFLPALTWLTCKRGGETFGIDSSALQVQNISSEEKRFLSATEYKRGEKLQVHIFHLTLL
jgi:hypothetical protein